MEQVKLLSMTVVLTVLIWASADSLVNETVSIGVTFEPIPGAGASDMMVQAQVPNTLHEVQIAGPRKIVEDVQAQAPLSVRLPIRERPTGPAVIPLDRDRVKREMATQWNEFRKLTIISVFPDTLAVQVDHWIQRDVGLVLSPLTLAYDVEPQLARTSVVVRMRESRIEQWPDPDRLQISVAADVERLLKERPAGQNVTIPVTLDNRPFGPDATLTPATVRVTATVKALRTVAEIPTVPILFAVSAANLERPCRPVTRDGTPLSLLTRTITVTGPTDMVTQLLRGSQRAYGIIHLKQADLEELGALKLASPEYRLPPGVELAEEPAPIEFKLIDVTVTPGGK